MLTWMVEKDVSEEETFRLRDDGPRSQTRRSAGSISQRRSTKCKDLKVGMRSSQSRREEGSVSAVQLVRGTHVGNECRF